MKRFIIVLTHMVLFHAHLALPMAETEAEKTPIKKLLAAARDGKVDEVKELIQEVDPNTADGSTFPLLEAAQYGQDEVINVLLDPVAAGVPADKIKGKADINKKNISGKTALMQAILFKRGTTIELLIEKGADPALTNADRDNALHFAARNNLALYLIQKINGNVKNDISAYVNAENYLKDTPLLIALQMRHFDIIPGLLEDTNIDHQNSDGYTALMLAAQAKAPMKWIHTFLEQYKADPNIQNNQGYNALMLALSTSNLDAAKILLPLTKDIHVQDNHGYTALYFAVSNKLTDIIPDLLKKGAPVNSGNPGQTPWDLAQKHGYETIKKLLNPFPKKEHSAETQVQLSQKLMSAIITNNTAEIDTILTADPSLLTKELQNNTGTTPVIYAARYSRVTPDTLGVVLNYAPQHKIDLNLTDSNGGSALWWAVGDQRGDSDSLAIVKKLIDAGAQPDEKTIEKAQQLAASSKDRKEIYDLIEKAKLKPAPTPTPVPAKPNNLVDTLQKLTLQLRVLQGKL